MDIFADIFHSRNPTEAEIHDVDCGEGYKDTSRLGYQPGASSGVYVRVRLQMLTMKKGNFLCAPGLKDPRFSRREASPSLGSFKIDYKQIFCNAVYEECFDFELVENILAAILALWKI